MTTFFLPPPGPLPVDVLPVSNGAISADATGVYTAYDAAGAGNYASVGGGGFSCGRLY